MAKKLLSKKKQTGLYGILEPWDQVITNSEQRLIELAKDETLKADLIPDWKPWLDSMSGHLRKWKEQIESAFEPDTDAHVACLGKAMQFKSAALQDCQVAEAALTCLGRALEHRHAKSAAYYAVQLGVYLERVRLRLGSGVVQTGQKILSRNTEGRKARSAEARRANERVWSAYQKLLEKNPSLTKNSAAILLSPKLNMTPGAIRKRLERHA